MKPSSPLSKVIITINILRETLMAPLLHYPLKAISIRQRTAISFLFISVDKANVLIALSTTLTYPVTNLNQLKQSGAITKTVKSARQVSHLVFISHIAFLPKHPQGGIENLARLCFFLLSNGYDTIRRVKPTLKFVVIANGQYWFGAAV